MFRRLNVCMNDIGRMGGFSNLTFPLTLTSMQTFRNIEMSEQREVGIEGCPSYNFQ